MKLIQYSGFITAPLTQFTMLDFEIQIIAFYSYMVESYNFITEEEEN